MDLVLYDEPGKETRRIPMTPEEGGYFHAHVPDAGEGTLYKLSADGRAPVPDVLSRRQPKGVNGPSQVSSASFEWSVPDWKGFTPGEDVLIEELHVGTMSPNGKFSGLIPQLDAMKRQGITAVQLMPVSFNGSRNWGYDVAGLFAPAEVYGGPDGLKELVDACHQRGLKIILDVVYNHRGPEGQHHEAFTSKYLGGAGLWGGEFNFDEDVVREMVLRNVEMWIRDFRIDGLRLDATHAIRDRKEPHLLQEIVERARAAAGDRNVWVVAEDDRKDNRVARPIAEGGLGLDAQWADDLGHAAFVWATGQRGFYLDNYEGTSAEVARLLRDGWGQKPGTTPKGTDPRVLPADRFVVSYNNHDQTGNDPLGRRRMGPDFMRPAQAQVVQGLLELSPYTVMRFRGDAWGTQTPFIFFVGHEDPLLREATKEGRRNEQAARFKQFQPGDVPDPSALKSFHRSVLDANEVKRAPHKARQRYSDALRTLRLSEAPFQNRAREGYCAKALGDDAVLLRRTDAEGNKVLVLANIDGKLRMPIEDPDNAKVLLWSNAKEFGGPGGSPLRDGQLTIDGPGLAVVGFGDGAQNTAPTLAPKKVSSM